MFVGHTLSVLGWVILLLAVTIIFALAGWYWLTPVSSAAAFLFVRRYRRNWRDQRHLARRILQEVRGKLQRAA